MIFGALIGATSALIAFVVIGERTLVGPHDPFIFLPHYVFSYDESKGRLFIQGTWALENGDDAYPQQTTTLECSRESRNCLEASAVVARDLLLPIRINRLAIAKWSNVSVTIERDASECVSEIYEIDLRDETIVGIAARRRDGDALLCATFASGAYPRKMRMIDGYKRSQRIKFHNETPKKFIENN